MKHPIKIAAFLGLLVTTILVVVPIYRFYNTPERISKRAIESIGGHVTRFFGANRLHNNAVCVSFQSDISEEQLTKLGVHLPKLRSVEALELTGATLNDSYLENYLAQTPNLQQLKLYETNATAQALASLKNPNNLTELHIYGRLVTPNDVQIIGNLENLTSLAISSDGSGLGELQDLAKLESLAIRFTQTPDAEIDTLSKLTNLHSLELYGTISDSSIRFARNLPNLEFVDVTSTNLTDSALLDLCNPQRIRWLRLGGTKITGTGFDNVTQSNIQYLDLDDTLINDDGLAAIAKIGSLERLNINNTKITDKGVRHLSALKLLEYLHIQNTNVTDESATTIRNLPNLVYLEIQDSKLSDSGVATIKQNARLEWLNHLNIRWHP